MTDYMMSFLTHGYEKVAGMTENSEKTKEIKRILFRTEVELKVAAVSLAIFALFVLNYSLPAMSLLGTTIGALFGTLAYDSWTLAMNLENDKDLPKGILTVCKSPLESARDRALKNLFEEKAARIVEGTLIVRHIFSLASRAMDLMPA